MIKRLIWYARFFIPVLYKYVFDVLYMDVIAPQYSYFGSYAELNSEKQIATWVALGIVLIGMAILREDLLKSFFRVMLYFSIIPSFSLYGLKNGDNTAFTLIVLYWIMMLGSILVIQKIWISKNKMDAVLFLHEGNESYIWFFFFLTFFTTILLSGTYSGFRLFIKFSDVYYYRNLVEVNSFVPYILGWNTRIILPVLMYIFLSRKCYVRFFICFFLMIISYSIFGNKTMFFTALLVIGISVLSKFKLESLTDVMVSIFLLIYQLICLFFPIRIVLGLIHRFLVVPAEAHYYYYDFFQTHELLYLRQNILRHFFEAPYDRPVYSILGQETKYYFSSNADSINNANNGLFSDAYQNFATVGVLLYPMIIIITFCILFKSLDGWDKGIQFIILLMSVLFLFSSSYFSWLFTGGVIPLLLILGYVKKNGERIRMYRLKTEFKSG